jgi:NADPH:quinone reductase-like Zn-dependent oxidoreductase
MDNARRVFQFDRLGGPEVLQIHYLPVPDPSPGEVRVRVEAMSLNRADLLWVAGAYLEQPSLPSTLGYEVCGIVEAVGYGVTHLHPGDRVSTLPGFSLTQYGGFAEAAIFPGNALMRTPTNLSPAQGASFTFSYLTGYFALFETARVMPGMTVLITAGTSTTGLAAVHLAKLAGARVIATTRSRTKASVLEQAGVDRVIVTSEEEMTEAVLGATNGRGADIVYDCVMGGGYIERLASVTAGGGTYIAYGILDHDLREFPWLTAFVRGVRFHFYKVFDYMGHGGLGIPRDEAAVSRGLRLVGQGIAEGDLPVVIDRSYSGIENLIEAMFQMQASQAAGKLVVLV